MKPKRYDGYRSYSYLEPGLDYRPFKLVRELGRVPGYPISLTRSRRRGSSGSSTSTS